MSDLKHYIENKMKMSAIYQPVIIKALLENGGNVSMTLIAQELVKLAGLNDAEGFLKKLKIHPSAVLLKNGVASNVKGKYPSFKLLMAFEEAETEILIKICSEKINNFLKK